MPQAYIGVGSNIDPENNIRDALRMLKSRVSIIAISTFYRTEPDGDKNAPWFINGVIEIDTELTPADLKSMLHTIEDALGRVRTEDKFAPRTIDLDIVIYDYLMSPAPEITERPFLSIPLYELSPDLLLPGEGIPIKEIAESHKNYTMVVLSDFTEMLRGDVFDEQRTGAAASKGTAD